MNKNLQQLFDEFIYECEYVRKSSTSTLLGYKQTFNLFNKLIPEQSLESINRIVLMQFFKNLDQRKRISGKGIVKVGIKKSTVATYWKQLNSFFDWLTIHKHIHHNPLKEMRCPTPLYEEKKFLKKEQIEKILTAILLHSGKNILVMKRNLVVFHLLLFCGLRREELTLLQIRDIDFDRRILTVRAETCKVRRARYLPIHHQLLLHLKDYLRERKAYTTPYLIVSSRKDDKLSNEGLKHFVNKIRTVSGVQFHLHQFRHTFAVNFLKGSNNIAKLKQLLGHKDISMTLHYLRCLPPTEMRADINNMSIDNMI